MRACLLVLALASCGKQRSSSADAGQDAALAIPMVTVPLARVDAEQAKVDLMPEDSLWGVIGCYGTALLKNPKQSGDLAVTLTPPPKDGDITLSLAATGSLDASVVDCVRTSLGRYRVWPGGRRQERVSTTLHLEPVDKVVPAPPTDRALRQILESHLAYARDVVRVASIQVLSVTQNQRRGLSRGYDCALELELLRDGYEMECQRENGPYKIFAATLPNADIEPFPCKAPIARRAGARASDNVYVGLALVEGKGWTEGKGRPYYCGDGPCPY
jgi:hypothetical protein